MTKFTKYASIFTLAVMIFLKTQGQEPYSIEIDRYKKPGSKKTVMEKASLWMLSEPDLHFLGRDTTRGILMAESKFAYKNEVILEMVFLSPRIGEKTSGEIHYDLNVYVSDTSYSVEFTNFYHVSEYDSAQYSFGRIPKYPEEFNTNCNEHPDWCKLVWMDITKTAKIKTRMKRIKASW